MRANKWRVLTITSVIILAPILYGLSLYDELPARMAIHFNINNQPDQWAAKPFVLFGLPILLLALQWICVLITAVKTKTQPPAPRLERVVYSIVPVISVVVYIVTIQFSLGAVTDIRRIILLLIGLVFIALGNYFPTVPVESQWYVSHPHPRINDRDLWRKMSRQLGYAFVVGGILMIVTLFFAPLVSAICLVLVIGWILGLSLYSWYKSRRISS